MNKILYPAIFHKAEEGGFWITFPDIPECMTQGDDMQHASEMAYDALALALASFRADRKPIPIPSKPFSISHEQGEFCVVIEFDIDTI